MPWSFVIGDVITIVWSDVYVSCEECWAVTLMLGRLDFYFILFYFIFCLAPVVIIELKATGHLLSLCRTIHTLLLHCIIIHNIVERDTSAIWRWKSNGEECREKIALKMENSVIVRGLFPT